jgi:glycosyltransferase involved in cell wall biosynthesis
VTDPLAPIDTGPRTLLMVTPYFPPEGGGLERYAKTIALALMADFGWRVVFVSSGPRGTPVTVTDEDGIRIYRVPTQVALSRTPLSVRWPKILRRIAADEGAVLVNAHAPVPGLSDAVAAMGGSLPFVLTYHAGPMRKGRLLPDQAIWLYEHTVMHFTATRSNAIICNSSYVRDVFARDFVGKSVVVPPGVDSSLFRPAPTDGPASANGRAGTDGPARVIFVSKLDVGMEFKGLDLLLRSTRALVDRGVDTVLEVVGSGDLLPSYERLAEELGLGPDRVRFRGYLDTAELVAAYQGATVAALPSGNESFGMSLAEAMACGLPVVASRTGGIPAVVDDGTTGLLVEHGVVEELTDALQRVIEDRALAAEFGRAGRRRAETEFDWAVRARATNDVFERALQAPTVAPTVAIVTPRYPPDVGGVERYSSQVAEGLLESDSLRPLVISTRPGLRTTYEHRNGVPVIRLGSWFKLSNTPFSPLWPFQIRRILRSRRVAVVNAHSPVPGLADSASAVAGVAPIVITYHAGSMRKGSRFIDFWISAYERVVLPRVLDKAAAVAVVSPTTRVSHRPGVKLVPPGVDLDVFTFAEPAAEPPVRLLFVGRLDGNTTWKGEQVLFEALGVAARTLPELRLEIVGDGSGRPAWEAAVADHGVADRVEFAGALGGDDLVAAYHRASIIVLPSTTEAESFGMCLIEAMACGRPVIGSRVGGIPFVIDQGSDGVLVPPGDVGALATALVELGRDPERRRLMGRQGRHKVESRFSVVGLQHTYQKLFEDFLP